MSASRCSNLRIDMLNTLIIIFSLKLKIIYSLSRIKLVNLQDILRIFLAVDICLDDSLICDTFFKTSQPENMRFDIECSWNKT